MTLIQSSRTSASESGTQVSSGNCAIITTYEPATNLRNLITAAIRQVDCVFLIDDSGSSEVQKTLDTNFADTNGLEIHHMPKNSGIAAALNLGLAVANRRGYKKALLLDDDTQVAPHLVITLSHAWEMLERQGRKPGAIGVSRAKILPPAIGSGDEKKPPVLRAVRTVITAGSFVDIDLAKQIGGFREEFIIDAVDYEFCARLRQGGRLVARLSESMIVQPVGMMKTVELAGLKFSTTNHSPLRRYYMYRNNLVFAMEQFFKDPLLSIALVWFLIKTVFLVACLETQRARKINAMFRGVLDGIQRRLGHAQRSF